MGQSTRKRKGTRKEAERGLRGGPGTIQNHGYVTLHYTATAPLLPARIGSRVKPKKKKQEKKNISFYLRSKVASDVHTIRADLRRRNRRLRNKQHNLTVNDSERGIRQTSPRMNAQSNSGN